MQSLSVAMATYNGGKHLREQMDSIFAQTVLPLEIVIRDDQSTDETVAIARSYIGRSPDVDVRVAVNPERLGYKRNFMAAAAQCVGDVIAFCDQDDVWMPEKVETLLGLFEAPDTMVVVHDSDVMDGAGNSIGAMTSSFGDARVPRLRLAPWAIEYGYSMAFRRAMMFAAPRFEELVDPYEAGLPMSHDQWALMIGTVLGEVAFTTRKLARYRQHGNNVVGWHPPETLSARLAYWLEDRRGAYSLCAEAARRRARLFASLADDAPERWRPALREASDAYDTLEDAYRRRTELYGAVNGLRRFTAFRALLAMGVYSDDAPFSFARKGMLKDMLLGLVGSSLLRRFGRPAKGGDPSCRATGRAPRARMRAALAA